MMKRTALRTLFGVGLLGMALMPSSAFATPQNDAPKTADNQPNNKEDVRLAAKVRRAIVRDKTLSMRAHNVKIIASNGAVTLAGEVKSEEEKTAVVAKAAEIVGAGNVTDQLTVQGTK